MRWTVFLVSLMCLAPAFVLAEPWPLSPTNDEHRVIASYGQFAESTSNLPAGYHYHEGIDISAAGGTNVLAVAAGTIQERFVVPGAGDKYSQFLTVSLMGNVHVGWGYVHMRFGTNPATGMTWAVGDNVAVGDTLGEVDEISGSVIYSHLHLEYDNDSDGWHPTGAGGVAALNGDPLEFMHPADDTTKPVIDHLRYRRGDDEGMAAATYLTAQVGGKTVIYGNIDLIVEATEMFGAFPVPLSVQEIEFSVDGPQNIAVQTLEEFTGTFIMSPGSFTKFRNSDLAQVIYEADNTAGSNQDLGSANGTDNEFHYIVTNKDDDDDLELTDRDRYWNTDRRTAGGALWNDIDAAGNGARVNQEAFFEDGIYTVKIVARDEAGNENDTFEREVVLDNFRPYVKDIEVGALPLYAAEWLFVPASGTLLFSKTSNEFLGRGSHQIRIEFSEPVKNPLLMVAGFPAPVALASTDPPNAQKVWTGMLMITDSSHDGEQTLTITAKDLADNDLDGEPGSIASRNAMGMWLDPDDGGGMDDNHRLRIDGTMPTAAINIQP